ncbi:MAG: hypothetical protein AAF206_18690 [Bacteroidota bacterium]
MAIILLLATLFFSIFTSGINWYLQTNHFPSLVNVSPGNFHDYHKAYNRRGLFSFWGPGLLGLGLNLMLLFRHPWSIPDWQIQLALVLIILALASSLFLNFPQHKILGSHGYSDQIIRKLVNLNWLRTLLCTAHSIWLTWVVYQLIDLTKL